MLFSQEMKWVGNHRKCQKLQNLCPLEASEYRNLLRMVEQAIEAEEDQGVVDAMAVMLNIS